MSLIVRECLDKPYFDDRDLANVLANGPEIAWLYAFLLGLAPLLIVRSRKLPLFIAPLGIPYATELSDIADPAATFTECPISGGGNHADFYGAFAGFLISYTFLLIIFYVMLTADILQHKPFAARTDETGHTPKPATAKK